MTGRASYDLGRRVALGIIWLYRHCISGLKPPCCRFSPTCSAYARDAVSRFGLWRGSFLTVKRLGRCHPFYRGPFFDPIPPSRRDERDA